MGQSLEKKLKGKESEVAKSIMELGGKPTMALYQIKTRKTFIAWLNQHGIEWPTELLPGMSGGQKAMFLSQHRDMVLEFLKVFGDDETQRVFRLTHDTLEGLIRGGHKPFHQNFTKADKALAKAEIAIEGQRAINRRMDKLEDAFAQFTQAVGQRVGNDFKMAIALALEQSIKVPSSLEVGDKPDPLNFDGLFKTMLKPEADQTIKRIMQKALNPFTEK